MVLPRPKLSFAPVIPQSARVLILGSLPGQKSIDAGEYYAHPRNRFWPVIAAIADRESAPNDYQAKLSLLDSLGVALWDVVREAHRAGSLDTNITGEAPNEIDRVLAAHPDIRTVGFNGRAAETIFDRYFERGTNLRFLRLPSTSPANAQFNLERLVAEWRCLFS